METPSNPLIRTLQVSFDLPIFPRQIPQWRGAFVEFAGIENDLFHNHKNDEFDLKTELEMMEASDPSQISTSQEPVASSTPPILLSSSTYHYRYPLIQYRMRRNHAAIFAINDGIEALQTTLSSRSWGINWEGEPRQLQITGMEMNEYHLRMLARPKTYRLYKWLALNEKNYKAWLACGNLVERIQLLERILNSHLLAFARSVGWRLPERLKVSIKNIQQVSKVRCHNTPLLAFSVTYTANALLPPHIALGKAVSHGFGWQRPVRLPTANKQREGKSSSRERETE